MISLQRSMHSSQMYTPGPAMSFLTCFWLFPQKEHFSRSPPSPIRATRTSPCSRGPAPDHVTYDGTAFRAPADPLGGFDTACLVTPVSRLCQVLTASRLDFRVLMTSSTSP